MFSRKKLSETTLRNPKEVLGLMKMWGPEFCFDMLEVYQIDVKYIEHSTGAEYGDAKMQIAKMQKTGCLKKKHSFWVKTPAFIAALKRFVENPEKLKEEF
jgi:hypothetical protein